MASRLTPPRRKNKRNAHSKIKWETQRKVCLAAEEPGAYGPRGSLQPSESVGVRYCPRRSNALSKAPFSEGISRSALLTPVIMGANARTNRHSMCTRLRVLAVNTGHKKAIWSLARGRLLLLDATPMAFDRARSSRRFLLRTSERGRALSGKGVAVVLDSVDTKRSRLRLFARHFV